MKRRRFGLLLGVGGVIWAARSLVRSRFSFDGKVVMISGGSRGLGLLLAREFAAKGGRLVLLARDESELAAARQQLRDYRADVLTIRCDLTMREEILRAVERAVAEFGGIDVLVNNAGVIEVGPLAHMQRADFERSLAVHFWGPYELTMAVRPIMRRRGGGRIVNITSIGGKIAVPHMTPYTAGKFALTGFSDGTRAELAREGIAVTTVAPGMMRTGSQVNARFKGNHEAEYGWFSLSNGIPFFSISGRKAAAKIVNACREGRASLVLTLPARLAIAGNAVLPGLTARAMKIANRLLPRPTDLSGNELRSGREIKNARHLA